MVAEFQFGSIMAKRASAGKVLVAVVPVSGTRQIGWGSSVSEQLDKRLKDIRDAIQSGSMAVASSLEALPGAKGWRLSEVEAKFGVTLTAQAGAILTKASTEATFEVTVTFEHEKEPELSG